jgi:signal transduction histidine kinase
VEVEVQDHGPGIPEDEQPAVFERFRRGRGVAASGVGLGLYIAQAYVQAMHGEIGVRSTPGQGATFWFRLPAAGDGLIGVHGSTFNVQSAAFNVERSTPEPNHVPS